MGLTKEQREKLLEKAGQKQQEHAVEQVSVQAGKQEKKVKKGLQLPKGLKKPSKKALMIGGGVVAALIVVIGCIAGVKTGLVPTGGATSESANGNVSMTEGAPDGWSPDDINQQQFKSVRLTADLVPDISAEDVQAQVESLSWFDGILNSDGSVTYTMQPEQLAAMQTSLKEGLETLKADYAAKGIEVVISDDLLKVTVKGAADADRVEMMKAAEQIARQVRLCAVYNGEQSEQYITTMGGDVTYGGWYWTDLQDAVNKAVNPSGEKVPAPEEYLEHTENAFSASEEDVDDAKAAWDEFFEQQGDDAVSSAGAESDAEDSAASESQAE